MTDSRKDKVFIDTNILCYLLDKNDKERQTKSASILQDLQKNGVGQISTQSLQEVSNVALKKMNFSSEEVSSFLSSLRKSFPVYTNTADTVESAVKISAEYQFSFWDSLILAAAIESGCSILYSEDLSNGQIVDGVKIVNPLNE